MTNEIIKDFKSVARQKETKIPLFLQWLLSLFTQKSRKERTLRAATGIVDKELDLLKFIERIRLMLTSVLVLLKPEQE